MEWTLSATLLAVFVPLTIVSLDVLRRLILNRVGRKGYPLPPGPNPLPFLGNALSINAEEPHRTYTEWQAKYGEITYARVLNMDLVVLNSLPVTTDLLDKRSRLYSDRPFIATAVPYGHDCNFSLAQYGEHWRMCRRIFHQTFRADTASNFHPIQLHKVRQMILSVMEDPSDYAFHYSTFSAAVTMRSVYDYDPSSQNDQLVSKASNFLEASVSALQPEKAALFGVFPFLLYIPDWLPGAWIRHEASASRKLGVEMVEAPYQYAKKLMKTNGYVCSSMVSDHITRMDKMDDPQRSTYEKALKHTSSTAFLASVETTSSLLMSFTLEMVKNIHVWKRAQAEIDAVVGTTRLPEFDDRPLLPYVEAILRETMRMHPPITFTAHATTCSDIYNGFYIPKGATIITNVWGLTRDETRYPNPEAFIPERFLDARGMLVDDIPSFIFGFGRRVCPGRYFADASAWCAIVTLLAAFDFNHAKDVDGNDVAFEVAYSKGVARHPLPFPCHIAPRPHMTKTYLERVLAR